MFNINKFNNSQIEKKFSERKILNKVYNENEFTIEEEEEPDFILKHKKYNERIGVEITELFINQSSARIKKIPNYVSRIINEKGEKRYADKKDIRILPTVKIYTKNVNNKYSKILDAVKVPTITIQDYIEKITEIIKNKNTKNYKSKCENIELVINDTEEFFNYIDISMLNIFLTNKELIYIVKSSIFRVVYIISKYNGEDVIITIGEKKNSVNLDRYKVVTVY